MSVSVTPEDRNQHRRDISREISSKYDIDISLDEARKYFSTLSANQQSMCEVTIGKKKWEEMSCCSRFWSYLGCESYQQIGRRIIKAIPHTYVVIYKLLKINEEKEKAQREARHPNLKIDIKVMKKAKEENNKNTRVIYVEQKKQGGP